MLIYNILVFIHIFSAILGMGPGFVMIYIVTKATTMTELKHAFFIRNRVHIFVMIGGTSLLVTGILMGIINTALFYQGWYIMSIIIFLITLAAGPFVLKPISAPIKMILATHQGDDIPDEYYILSKKLFTYERVLNTLFLIIIALMITKPF